MDVIVSFDVEEHDRIEAAAGLVVSPTLRKHYRERLNETTQWLLYMLDHRDVRATFFVVGQVAIQNPKLIRLISSAGHEVASHGWDHRRVMAMTPEEFREDVRLSKDALEQATGKPVVGYRAPTFSVVRRTAWALDILVESGMVYDSSIYPVRHDRYGVPRAPRGPFLAEGERHAILELPPVTLRVAGVNIPMGGGGYFRLFPQALIEWALCQTAKHCDPAIAMLYFHPWEFDPDQTRLPLKLLSRFRTYVGLRRTRARLIDFLKRHRFARGVDVAQRLIDDGPRLPRFSVSGSVAETSSALNAGNVNSR
jgi:polysaccharide deacetylase family protein (PEP-CTERM system associated)